MSDNSYSGFMNKEEREKTILYLIITYMGALAGCYGVNMFNRYVMMSLPLAGRMVCMVTMYWVIALIPIIIMLISGTSLQTIGFEKEKIGLQIVIGIVSGGIIASAIFLVPYFMGYGEIVDNGMRYKALWQFGFDYFYKVISIGAVEEIIFRGVIYQQLKKLFGNDWGAILISSVLFGFFHIFTGYVIQILMTAIIGFIFCMVRHKMKRCSLLSLILMHGTYDFFLVLYPSLLF